MKYKLKKVTAFLLCLLLFGSVLSETAPFIINASAQSISYGSWSGWSGWQDSSVSEVSEGGQKIREVQTQTVESAWKTVYHYYRYANSSGSAGSSSYSSTYCNWDEITLDYALTEAGTAGGYKYWYNGTNYHTYWPCADNGSTVATAWKTQYSYRTRTATYSYTVSYNANGGTGAPSSQTKTKVVSVNGTTNNTLKLSSTKPTKSYTITYNANNGSVSTSTKSVSCTFNGWNTKSDGSGTNYSAGGNFTSNADTTLYAKWTNPTAGTLETPTRTGYSFDGWYTAASGGNPITSTSDITSNITIYAHWTANTYTVSYNANGGSGVPSNQTKTYGVDLTLTSSTPTTAKKYTITYNANGGSVSTSSKSVNCTFSKWNTKADGSGTAYSKGATYKENAAATLYAQWTNPTAGTLETPTRTNYKFDGWFTAASGGTQVTSSTTISQNTTIYAHWTLNAYDVIYDANGGSGAPSAQKKIHGQTLTLTSSVPSTAKSYKVAYNANSGSVSPTSKTVNCTFNNWNTKADGSGTAYSKSGSYTSNAGVTLYAQWTNPTYGTLPTPTRTGYTFDGWYTAVSGGTKITSSSTLSKAITIYAHWTANKYTITFNANGGSCSTKTKEVTYGSTYGTLPTPTYVGHNFTGWYSDSSAGSQYLETATVTITENKNFFAHWTDKAIKSISVDLNNTKTNYYVGDTFDTSKVTVIITYSDNETQSISNGFECSTPLLNKETTKRVTVSYKGFESSFDITIVNAPLQSISVESLPTEVIYSVGDEFDESGLKIKATYQNGYSQIVTGNLSYNYNFLSSGTKNVSVSYSENGITKSTSFSVTVKPTPKIYSDSVTGYNGETITIPIKIADNQGVMGIGLEVEYDASVMTPISVSQGNIINGSLNDSISTSKDNIFKIVWSGTDNITSDGVLFNIQFNVTSNAYGTYNIKLSYDNEDTFNSSWNTVKLDCQNINVNIIDREGLVPKIISKNFTVSSGDIVDVPINIVNNSNITSTTITIQYNSEAFSIVGVIGKNANVVSENSGSANGIFTIILDNISLSANISELFTLQLEAKYYTPGTYLLTIANSNNIKCENSSIKLIEGNATLYADSIQGSGTLLTVPIKIKGNTGIMGFKVLFEYDSTILTPISATQGSIITSGMMENNISTSAPGSFYVIWVGNDDINKDGECIVLTFQLKTTSIVPTQIEMSYSQPDTYNSNWEDVVLNFKAIQIGNDFEIIYNANGGTGAPSNQTKINNKDLTLSSTKPTKSITITLNPQNGTVTPTSKTVSYTFKNWNTQADGTGTNYTSGATYSANSSATLYAQWTNPAAYALPTPTRTGYTFNGWNTKSDGTGTSYAAGANYSATANVTLYAIWSINTYTVSYNANGGTGAPTNQTKTYGTDLTLSSTKPTRSVTITLNPQSGTVSPTSKSVSYTFNNWKATDGTTYAAGAAYKENEGTTLTAQWTNPTAYALPTPTRTGYTFNGWNTKSDGTGTSYAAGANYNATANVTLYAIWEANTYTIIYNANGGTGAPANQIKIYGIDLTLSNTKPTGKSVTITLNPQSGTVSPTSKSVSYTFKNWRATDGTTYAAGAAYKANEGTTLTAQWTNPTAYALPTPTRTGYTFKGWNTKADGTGTSYAAGASYSATANITLYAQWETNHVHSYTSVVTEPTCTQKGYTTHTCLCGDSFVDSYVDELGHHYADEVCERCKEHSPNYELFQSKKAAISELENIKSNAKSDEAKAALDTAIANVDKATNLDDVAAAKSDGFTNAINADRSLTDAKENAIAELSEAKKVVKSDEAKSIIDTAISSISGASSIDSVNSIKDRAKTDAATADNNSGESSISDEKLKAITELFEAKKNYKTEDAKNIIDEAIGNISKANTVEAVNYIKDKALSDANNADNNADEKELSEAKLNAIAELNGAKKDFKTEDAKNIIDEAIGSISKATTVDEVNSIKAKALSDANLANSILDSVVINVASERKIDYRSKVIIKATAKNLPEGYYLMMTIDGKSIKGTNTEVSYEISELTKDVSYSVKIVDSNGNVQKTSDGKELSKDGGKITCNAGFFKKLIAFFKKLFKSLPTITVKP